MSMVLAFDPLSFFKNLLPDSTKLITDAFQWIFNGQPVHDLIATLIIVVLNTSGYVITGQIMAARKNPDLAEQLFVLQVTKYPPRTLVGVMVCLIIAHDYLSLIVSGVCALLGFWIYAATRNALRKGTI
jgi:hypothetical protein